MLAGISRGRGGRLAPSLYAGEGAASPGEWL